MLIKTYIANILLKINFIIPDFVPVVKELCRESEILKLYFLEIPFSYYIQLIIVSFIVLYNSVKIYHTLMNSKVYNLTLKK